MKHYTNTIKIYVAPWQWGNSWVQNQSKNHYS